MTADQTLDLIPTLKATIARIEELREAIEFGDFDNHEHERLTRQDLEFAEDDLRILADRIEAFANVND